jgi:hypothetical protein
MSEELYNIWEEVSGQWAGHWTYSTVSAGKPDNAKLAEPKNLTLSEAVKKCQEHNAEQFDPVTV